MKRYVLGLLSLLLITLSQQLLAQDEFFHELSLEKVFIEDEKWEFAGEVDWKNLYNEEGWRRWGISLAGTWNAEPFRLSGGLNGYYTFNRSITNFFELRPWMALRYNLRLGSKISIRQRLKAEWRFFYDDGEAPREDYRRFRYQVGLDIPLGSGEHEASWSIRPHFEWYFIRDPATFERFPNERDFGLTFIRELGNHHEISIGYRIEAFYHADTERGNGHLFTIGYSL